MHVINQPLHVKCDRYFQGLLIFKIVPCDPVSFKFIPQTALGCRGSGGPGKDPSRPGWQTPQLPPPSTASLLLKKGGTRGPGGGYRRPSEQSEAEETWGGYRRLSEQSEASRRRKALGASGEGLEASWEGGERPVGPYGDPATQTTSARAKPPAGAGNGAASALSQHANAAFVRQGWQFSW